MILIDCLYINNGGGKILLDYLVKKLEERNENVFYLFDERCKNDFLKIPTIRKIYLPASLIKRHQFYKESRNRFKTVLCFGNLPPTVRLSIPVYTYFHQPMFLNVPEEYSFKAKVTFKLKQYFLKIFEKNNDFWIVQNGFMKKGLIQKYSLKTEKVIVLPFYPNEGLSSNSSFREKNTFIYVSNAGAHKNHLRLLSAFCSFYDKTKIGKLIVTVSPIFDDIYKKIEDLKSAGYPIVNIGFVERKELIKNYHKAEYLIFPSLEESFGLGIVEAIECGCKVIGADLPYMYQVCTPSIKFNPKEIESIYYSFVDAINKKEQPTVKKINNEKEKLLNLLNS